MDDPVTHRQAFGRALRRLRRERELSQDALAHLSGVAAKHLSELERGRKEPRLGTQVQLADAFGMGLGELCARFDEERARPASE